VPLAMADESALEEPLPNNIKNEWKEYRISLMSLNELVIQRKINAESISFGTK